MATRLGEAFVEILADANPFADDFASAIGEAGETAESELADAMDEASGSVSDALGEAGAEGGAALTSELDDATAGVADVAAGAADDATSALGGIEMPTVDAVGAFAGLPAEADAAAAAAAGAIGDIDVPTVDAAGAFDAIPGEAEDAAGSVTAAFDDVAADVEASLNNISLEGLRQGVEENATAIGVGLTGAGAGAEGFARSQADANAQLARAENALGLAEGELRDMVVEMGNVHLSSSEAAEGIEALRQVGIDEKAQLEELVPQFDTLADAADMTIPEAVRNAGRGLGAMGVSADEMGEHVGAARFVINDLGGDMNVLGRRMRNVKDESEELGLGVDEMTGVLGPLVEETNSFRDATGLLQEAIRESEGDMGAFLDTLGMSEEEFAKLSEGAETSSERVAEEAQIANETQTPLESLQQIASNLGVRFGGLADAAGTAGAALSGAGPALLGIAHAGPAARSAISGVRTVASGAAGALGSLRGVGAAMAGVLPTLGTAVTGLSTAMKGLAATIWANPLFIIVGVIVGIIAIVWVFRDEIMAALGAAFDWLGGALDTVIGWLKELPGKIVTALVGMATTVVQFIVKWHPLAILIRLAAEYWDDVVAWFAKLIAGIVEWFTSVRDRATALVRGLWQRVVQFFGNLVADAVSAAGRLRDRVVDAVTGLVDSAKSLFGDLVSWVAGLPGRIVSAIGDLGSLLVDKGRDLIRGLWDGITGMGDWLWNKLKGWAADVLPGPVASALGLSSPSKLFAGFGQDIVRGLAEGIDFEADTAIAEIERFANRASLAGEPAVPVGAPAGGERPVEVTVHQQPGESGEESVTRALRRAGYLAGGATGGGR